MENVQDMKKPVSGGSLEDTEMKGVSSLMKMRDGWSEGDDVTNGKAAGSGFGIDMNIKENGDEEQEHGKVDSGVNGNVVVENQNDEGDLVDCKLHEYSVGDFVWGKIKSHPWWPGRVYDPSHASEYALKLRQEGKLLVAYFGDGTFAWCQPSQLRPFEESFEEMTSQSSSKSFVNAVKEAVEEIGTLVNMKLTCPCVMGGTEEGRSLFVANSGIKEGVLMPDEGIEKLGALSVEPTYLLTTLRLKAREIASSERGVELGVLKGWILGFYRAKFGVGYDLPEYVEPAVIPGLEDRKEDAKENGEMGVVTRGPVEEEKEVEKNGASENGNQRKEKSIAEILLGSEPRSKEKVGPRKRKMANLLESSPVVSSGGSEEESKKKKKRGRKKKKIVEESEEDTDSSGELEEETEEKKKRGRKKKSVEDSEEAKDLGDKGGGSRERKKSRFLSPPYTNISMVGDKKFSPRSPREVLTEQKPLDSGTAKQVNGENVVVNMEIKASPREVLSTVRSLARYPQRRDSVGAVEGFLRNFRSSVYAEDPKSIVKSSKVKSRGRKSKKTELHSVPILEGQAPADLSSPESKPKKKRVKKANGAESDGLDVKMKDRPEPSDQKKGDQGASLVVSFGPGANLPTKEDLLRMFHKFGLVVEDKSDMYYNNFCGVVAFKKASDAESALASCQKVSPFGPASVTYELQHDSPKKQPKKKPKKPEVSEVEAIKEKLEKVTSMLDNSNGKKLSKKARARVEGKLKGVLEMISGSSSG